MSDPVVYKKYANRRLYDMQNSTYVTLEEVAEVIGSGKEIRVVEAKSKEDVTASILTQIILEKAKSRNLLLPVPVLHMIIRYGDNLLGEFLDRYLQPILQTYLSQRDAFERNFQQWIQMGSEFTEMAKRTAASVSPFSSLFDLGRSSGSGPARREKDTEEK
jgi:polyhydroxyalkanoate synthesis repressor PhaR